MSRSEHFKALPTPTRFRVVIPCRNEEAYIGKCIRSLHASVLNHVDLEVFVCDGMSDDGTRDVIAKHMDGPASVTVLDNPDRTTPQALNLGVRPAGADVIMILGAHAEVAPDLVQKCVDTLRKDTLLGCVGGIIENVFEDAVSRQIGAAMGSRFGVGNAHFRTGKGSGYVDTVAFGAYRREVFDQIGLFDEELVRNQDDEFNFRLIRSGHRIWLDPTIKSKYYVRASFAKLYQQFHQYGYWKVFVNLKHATVTTLRQVVPTAMVVGVLAGVLLAVLWPSLAWSFMLPALFYFTGALFASIRSVANAGDIPGVFRAFILMHWGYGIGYLKGIIWMLLLRQRPGTRSAKITR